MFSILEINPYLYTNYLPVEPINISSLGTAALDLTPVSPVLSTTSVLSPLSTIIDPFFSPRSISTIGNSTILSPMLDFGYPLSPIPIMNNVISDSMDNDISVRNKVNKYFFEKTFNKWITKSPYNKMLQHFKVNNNNIEKISKDIENNKLSSDDIKKIIQYILENIYTKYDLKHTLKRISKKNGIKFYSLKKRKSGVRDIIMREIKKKIKD
tara:strand:- start:4406 stop:5038 length:633 start_codon:yes stop_codon:yes gene_type:complete